jgi:1,4-dihydroxy-2-naphthoyl-CoA hydrolase
MINLASIQKIFAPLFPGLMGIEFKVLELDRVVAELTVRPDLCTSGDIMHGGAYMAFADTLGAVGTLLNLSDGQRTTTTDSSTKFIAGAKSGSLVVGESTALHRGRTTMVWQTMIKNDQGKLCAVVTQTQLIMDSASKAR